MTYVKCYKYGTYPAAATNPCVVETNASTPASCNDIDINWFSDDFSGTSLDSCKWGGSHLAAYSLTSGKLRLSSSASMVYLTILGLKTVTSSVPVTIETRISTFSPTDLSTSPKEMNMTVKFGSARFTTCLGYGYTAGNNYYYLWHDGDDTGHVESLGSSLTLPITLKIQRDSSNNVRLYFNGVQKGNTVSNSNAVGDDYVLDHRCSAGTLTVEHDYFTITSP